MRMLRAMEPWQSSDPQRRSSTVVTPAARNEPGDARVDVLRESSPFAGPEHEIALAPAKTTTAAQAHALRSERRAELMATPGVADRRGSRRRLPGCRARRSRRGR